jgi:hypothetical protein
LAYDRQKFDLPEETPVAPVDEVGRLLLQAARIIRERGWCQHATCDEDGRVCVLGAIYNVREPNHEYVPGRWLDDRCNAAERRMAKVITSDDIPTWNDEAGRTAAEVIEALEKAARLT